MNGCLVIIERELLALLRSGKTLAIFVAVAVIFSGVVLLKWPSSGIVDLNGARGREVFQSDLWNAGCGRSDCARVSVDSTCE